MNNALFCFAFEQLDDPIYRTIKNVYNVVFNSDYGNKNLTANNSLGSINYYFDWTRLPEGEYQVSTSLSSSTDSNTTNFGVLSVFCDFGQGNSTVFMPANLSGQRVASSNFLSMVYIEQAASVGPLVCYNDYTLPVFLNSRPENSNVNLYILQGYTGQTIYSEPIATVMNYTITFTFRWLGQKY